MDPRLSGERCISDTVAKFIQSFDEDSPQVLALQIPHTRTVFPGSLISGVPGQKLHHVVGGPEAALALDRLGRADGEEQD